MLKGTLKRVNSSAVYFNIYLSTHVQRRSKNIAATTAVACERVKWSEDICETISEREHAIGFTQVNSDHMNHCPCVCCRTLDTKCMK